jgi:pyruvate/2-oxoglutarate dehydrogenase complex dihydrolipoamide acyltransferase (E2) component
MATTEFRLPKMGMGMTEGTIGEWLVANGATVAEGEDIVEIGTDKVDTAIESPASGTIEIVVDEGETVDVGTLLARITA